LRETAGIQRKAQHFLSVYEPEEDVFNFPDSSSKQYKIKDDQGTFDELLPHFDFMTRVARDFINHMVNRKEIRSQGAFEDAHVLIANHVLDIDPTTLSATFKQEF
jgi:hypothetical protein